MSVFDESVPVCVITVLWEILPYHCKKKVLWLETMKFTTLYKFKCVYFLDIHLILIIDNNIIIRGCSTHPSVSK